MAHEINITNGIIYISFTGVITKSDLEQLEDELASIESRFDPTPDRITDLSCSDGIDLNFHTLSPFAFKRRKAMLRNHIKSALIVSAPLHEGFANMFIALNDHPQIAIRKFAAVEEALAWFAS